MQIWDPCRALDFLMVAVYAMMGLRGRKGGFLAGSPN